MMSSVVVPFIAGLVIGASVGAIVMALCKAATIGDLGMYPNREDEEDGC